jgi:serine/threonine-protein kinase RsbW
MSAVAPDNRLVIRNEVAELRRMTEWLWAQGREADVPEDLLFKLDVCANEAVTNIMSYAYDDQDRHDIMLTLDTSEADVCLVILDDGKPFNLLDSPEPRHVDRLEAATIGGLGIPLIRGLMPRCTYQRAAGRNILALDAQYCMDAAAAL